MVQNVMGGDSLIQPGWLTNLLSRGWDNVSPHVSPSQAFGLFVLLLLLGIAVTVAGSHRHKRYEGSQTPLDELLNGPR